MMDSMADLLRLLTPAAPQPASAGEQSAAGEQPGKAASAQASAQQPRMLARMGTSSAPRVPRPLIHLEILLDQHDPDYQQLAFEPHCAEFQEHVDGMLESFVEQLSVVERLLTHQDVRVRHLQCKQYMLLVSPFAGNHRHSQFRRPWPGAPTAMSAHCALAYNLCLWNHTI